MPLVSALSREENREKVAEPRSRISALCQSLDLELPSFQNCEK